MKKWQKNTMQGNRDMRIPFVSFEEMHNIPVKIIGIVKEVRNRSSFK